jgi:peptidoglycan glycosyltransferase
VNKPIRRLAAVAILGLASLLAASTWVQVIAADTYRNDGRNPRPNLAESGKERGLIVAAGGEVLAESIPDPADRTAFVRTYPRGAPFAHAVGYTSLLFGDAGLEATYVSQLRSRRDLTISDLLAAVLGRDLRPRNLQLTIDASLQEAAYLALDGQPGAVVALRPDTGEIIVMTSSPSFDPTVLLGVDAAERWQELLADSARPLSDRATRELYPPGSSFKAVVAAAAVDAGTAGPETLFPDVSSFPLPNSTATIENADGGACGDGLQVSLLTAFVRSCNTVFAELTLRLGAEELGSTAAAFGFNASLEFPWPVPPSVFPTAALLGDEAALAQSGIGERDVRVTPLQMAMVAAAAANQGVVMEPHLVARILDADGSEAESAVPEELGRAMAPATAGVLTQMMERVVTEGTGRRAAVPGVRVAGKTGTATGPDGRPHVWFIGFAPVEAPTIALAVLVEAGGAVGESASGGTVAAPIAGQLIERWLIG